MADAVPSLSKLFRILLKFRNLEVGMIIRHNGVFFLCLGKVAVHDLSCLFASALFSLVILNYNLPAFLFDLIEKLLGVTPYLGR
jgi:hypothetical protein